MTAAELKASIVDRAVRGLLVPQRDEEKFEKFERFEKFEKSRTSAASSQTSQTSDTSQTSPVPYDLPQGWVWKRGKDIGTMERGAGIKRNETVAEGLPCLRYGEIYTSYTHYLDKAKSFVPAALFKACKHIKKNDLVFTLTGENEVDIAKTLAYLGDEEIAAGGDLAIWSNHNCFAPYLAYMMAAPSIIKQKAQSATGNFIVHTSTKKIGEIMIPLPPLAEQKRIVAKIEELMPLVEEYGKAETELAALNDNFPTALRKSILQHAVEGRLTATWRDAGRARSPSAPLETAADLLEQIRKSRVEVEKCRNGRARTPAAPHPFTEDEKPFPIPETWAWVRLGALSDVIAGYAFDARGYTETGVKICGGLIILPEGIKWSECKYWPSTNGYEDFLLEENDVVVSLDRPWISSGAKIGIINTDDLPCLLIQRTARVRSRHLDPKFLSLLLKGAEFKRHCGISGVTVPHISHKDIITFPIPLPPLAEQKAIVARVEELLKLVEEMKE